MMHARATPTTDASIFSAASSPTPKSANKIDRAAAGFIKLGVGPGVKVGLFLPNCPQFVIAYFAILRAGGTVVCYSPLYADGEIQHQVEDSETRFMVTLNLKVLYPKMRAVLDKGAVEKLIVGNLPEVLPFPKNLLYPLAKAKDVATVPNDSRHLSFGELLNNSGVHEPAPIDPRADIAVLQYTGGTTGVSKGAMLTHANLYANTVQAQLWFTGIEPGAERMLGVLPFFHIFAMTVVMNYSIHIGAEIVMHPRFELDAVLKDIDKKKPTLMPGVPTMFAAINGHASLAKFDLASIRACISGGAPLPLEVKQRFEKLTGCKLIEGYGLTEAAPIVTANPLEGLYKEGSMGLPVPGTRITITDREDPQKVLGLGERGEICVTGPQVMAGYWNRPEETAAALVEGRLRTGDVGYMDEDGYTFIIDRIKDLVLVSGFNVYPRKRRGGRLPAPGGGGVYGDRYRRRLLGRGGQGFRQAQGGPIAHRRGAFRVPRGQARQARTAQAHRVPRRAAEDHGRQALEKGARRRGSRQIRGRKGPGQGRGVVLRGPPRVSNEGRGLTPAFGHFHRRRFLRRTRPRASRLAGRALPARERRAETGEQSRRRPLDARGVRRLARPVREPRRSRPLRPRFRLRAAL